MCSRGSGAPELREHAVRHRAVDRRHASGRIDGRLRSPAGQRPPGDDRRGGARDRVRGAGSSDVDPALSDAGRARTRRHAQRARHHVRLRIDLLLLPDHRLHALAADRTVRSRPDRRRGIVPHLLVDRAPADQTDPRDRRRVQTMWVWNDFITPNVFINSPRSRPSCCRSTRRSVSSRPTGRSS